MTMKRKLGIIAVFLTVIGLGIALSFYLLGPSSLERQLLGAWDIGETESGSEVAQDLQAKLEPQVGEGIADDIATQLASQIRLNNERIAFRSTGEFTYDSNLLGLSMSEQGTWRVQRGEADQLILTLHIKKRVWRNKKGETSEQPKDVVDEWFITVLSADHLRAYLVDDEGKRKHFAILRAKD